MKNPKHISVPKGSFGGSPLYSNPVQQRLHPIEGPIGGLPITPEEQEGAALEAEVSLLDQALQSIDLFPRTSEPQESSAPHRPVNKDIIDRAAEYEKEIAPLLRPNIVKIREYFLKEVLPMLMAAHNGIADGVDVVKIALNETPSAGPFAKFFSDLIHEALKAKTFHFIKGLTALEPEAEQMFTEIYMGLAAPQSSKRDGSDIQALVRQMLEVHHVPRPSKAKAKTLVRQLQEDEGDREPVKPRRNSNRTQRKRSKPGPK